MAKNKDNEHLYVGRAGHLAVMAECLSRGWNVAIPEVDVGEDIFVVEDATSKLAKVQVKAATGKQKTYGFSAQFILPMKQLRDTSEKGNDLRYVLVTRYRRKWQPFVIIKRADLLNKQMLDYVGTPTKKGELLLTIYYYTDKNHRVTKIEAGTQKGFAKKSLEEFKENWNIFFKLRIVEGNMYKLKLQRIN